MRRKLHARNVTLLAAGAAAFTAAVLLAGCSLTGVLPGGGGDEEDDSNKLLVYNFGEYLDPDVIEMFEEETGYEVLYDEFETNEVMFPKVDANPSQYDVICPSDYMIAKMIENDLLGELDLDSMPNVRKNIGSEFWELSRDFDPENKYSVPYMWGTVGILYNTDKVHEEVDSWDILWDPKYRDDILMQDSVRDLFMAALKKQGHSMNTTDIGELEEARDLLIEEKPLVQAYVLDEVRDKMIAGEAALGVIYSGEAEYASYEVDNLKYAIPKEGTNVWLDSWVMTKEARHREAATAWIDFMARADVAVMNFEYIYYSTPNTAACELIGEEYLDNEVLNPDLSEIRNLEAYRYLGEETERLYFELWKEVKSA